MKDRLVSEFARKQRLRELSLYKDGETILLVLRVVNIFGLDIFGLNKES